MSKILTNSKGNTIVMTEETLEVLKPILDELFEDFDFEMPINSERIEMLNQLRKCKDLRKYIKSHGLPLKYLKYQVEVFQKFRKFHNQGD